MRQICPSEFVGGARGEPVGVVGDEFGNRREQNGKAAEWCVRGKGTPNMIEDSGGWEEKHFFPSPKNIRNRILCIKR